MPPEAVRCETSGGDAAHEAVEAVARRGYAALLGRLAARTRDVAGAEDALSDAFVAALRAWPERGVPRVPEAWLLTVARRRLIDAARHRRCAEEACGALRLLAEARERAAGPGPGRADELLARMHAAVDPETCVALVLQALHGFDAAAIAAVFRVPPTTMAQRLVRAKRRLRAGSASTRTREV